MKLKYKKIILLTTLSVMGIGLLTLSITNDKSQAKSVSNGKVHEESTDSKTKDKDGGTPTVTVVPSPTEVPVYNIKEDSYPEVTKLFKNFYSAKNDRDVNALKKLLSDPDKVESKKKLEKKTEYIDEYKNIKTYTKKGFAEGTYIVYVYHEIKFAGIKTAAPGLSKFYVITQKGKLKIFSGIMDADTKAYYDKRNEDKDVKDLIKMTNNKSNKAMKNDKDLKTFWKKIDKIAKKSE